MFGRIALMFSLLALAVGPLHGQSSNGQSSNGYSWNGQWDAAIECPGGDIRFGIVVETPQNGQPKAFLKNGPEVIEIPIVAIQGDQVTLTIDHFDSQLQLTSVSPEQGEGIWKKRRSADELVRMKVKVRRRTQTKSPSSEEFGADFLGRWQVKFQSSEDPAVGIFKRNGDRVLGTFLTTTGDYRFLDGMVEEREGQKELKLSCFDGAHAFLFRGRLNQDSQLEGDFWSSDRWHETWTAIKDSQASLPDDFQQTVATEFSDWDQLQFPNLDGEMTRLNDEKFQGQIRILYIFGSWCPNCHDAAEFLSTLEHKYAGQGLTIQGLAFEVTGDFQRDAQQVRKYLKRHDCRYPVLLAGKADKQEASKALPMIDRVRSFPTTIFLNARNQIIAVHSGFSGPATGAAYETLKKRFEAIIEKELR